MENRKIPKILICCPTSIHKDYCFDEWAINVKKFTYPGLKVFMSDNSPKSNYTKKITSYGFKTKRVNPAGKSNIQFICESHNQCRDYFLAGDWDYMLHLESDVFPTDPSFIQKLLLHVSDTVKVIGIPYHIGEGADSHLCLQMGVNDRTGLFTMNLKNNSDFNFVDGEVKRIQAMGLGCLLIHRSIVKRFPFRFVKGVDAHPDSWFHGDMQVAGQPVYADTSMICIHKNRPWVNGEQVKK